MCLMPFLLQNSAETNRGPLSDTIDSGIPNWAKSVRKVWMVVNAVLVEMGITFNHFE